MDDNGGKRRVVIEGVRPQIDGGRFPIKRVVGERVVVECDAFCDGHDHISLVVRWRGDGDAEWSEAPMEPLVNDRWQGSFTIDQLSHYRYAVAGWIDTFGTWRTDLIKKADAGQDLGSDLAAGAILVERAAADAARGDAERLRAFAEHLRADDPSALAAATDETLLELMQRYPDRSAQTISDQELTVAVDPVRARFSSWYELFPRSTSPDPNRQGTFEDVANLLPSIAEMGFDVLYLPPIHPIGTTKRKGPNNDPQGAPGAVGSPWAIGSHEGGHDAIDPALGTIEDFEKLVGRARDLGIDIAMDIAFQCSPDHPYVREHPEWFLHRPDGSIKHAENPPKKYEDIYPLDFGCEAWRELWDELKRIFEHWIARGVRVFRVDNPHTKAFRFWEWVIAELKAEHPDLIFLSEAFTRPKIMYHLAKLGFTQSYTYFAWRNSQWELTEYFTELTRSEVAEFFRPNCWPNTPDILTEFLQYGGRPAFMSRLILAGTLAASYGIYGPAYEMQVNRPIAPGKEEYRDSEKYEVKHWDRDDPSSLAPLVALVNRIRRENPALQTNETLRFHGVDNGALLVYSKATADRSNVILTVVNLDPHFTQQGWTALALDELGVDPDAAFDVEDLLTGARYRWQGPHNFVELNPHVLPAHIFRVTRSETEGWNV